MGRQINVIKDVSGKISISVWKAIDPPKNHHDFEVEVDAEGDNGWVCIGGGGRGNPRFFQENTEGGFHASRQGKLSNCLISNG